MSRTYLVFGSRDGQTWQPLGTVVADSHNQAQDTAANDVPGFTHYGSTPMRNWQSRNVSERVVRSWSDHKIANPAQLSFDARERVDELVEKAKDALDKPLAPKGTEAAE